MKKMIRQFILPLLLGIMMLTGCTNYGKKVTRDYLEVFYKEGITKEQAQQTADFLYPHWKEETGKTDKKSIQLTKSGDTVNFRMVVDEKKLGQIQNETFYDMGLIFSDSLFNGAPVNIVLTDNKFKAIRTLAFRKAIKEETPVDKTEKPVTDLPPSDSAQ